MKLDDLLSLQTLKLKRSMSSTITGPVGDAIVDQFPKLTQNVCAKISNELFARLDHVCGMLDLTKREFVEASLIEAVTRAEAQLDTLKQEA
jgi:hypothetical protein